MVFSIFVLLAGYALGGGIGVLLALIIIILLAGVD